MDETPESSNGCTVFHAYSLAVFWIQAAPRLSQHVSDDWDGDGRRVSTGLMQAQLRTICNICGKFMNYELRHRRRRNAVDTVVGVRISSEPPDNLLKPTCPPATPHTSPTSVLSLCTYRQRADACWTHTGRNCQKSCPGWKFTLSANPGSYGSSRRMGDGAEERAKLQRNFDLSLIALHLWLSMQWSPLKSFIKLSRALNCHNRGTSGHFPAPNAGIPGRNSVSSQVPLSSTHVRLHNAP